MQLSRTRDILVKVTQVIQDIGLIHSNNTKNKRTKQGGKDLRYKRTSDRKGSDEQNERDYRHFEDNMNTPSLPDPASNLDNPTHHAGIPRASPASRPLDPHSLTRTHTCPEDWPLPTSTAFELGEPCSTGNTTVQNESSDSCGSSLGSSPPSEGLEQDSREGIEGEEHPDPGGVGGTTGED